MGEKISSRPSSREKYKMSKMKGNHMRSFKNMIFGLVSGLMFTGVSFAATPYPIAECVNRQLLGAPRYEIRVVPAEGTSVPAGYELAIIPQNPTADEMRIDFGREDFIHYGDTVIVRINHGRSGYALVYFNGTENSLIDINLFRPDAMWVNTSGPVTSFTCSLVY